MTAHFCVISQKYSMFDLPVSPPDFSPVGDTDWYVACTCFAMQVAVSLLSSLFCREWVPVSGSIQTETGFPAVKEGEGGISALEGGRKKSRTRRLLKSLLTSKIWGLLFPPDADYSDVFTPHLKYRQPIMQNCRHTHSTEGTPCHGSVQV